MKIQFPSRTWILGVTIHLPWLCCPQLLSKIQVRVGDYHIADVGEIFADNKLCSEFSLSNLTSLVIQVHCDKPLEGRFILIQIPENKSFLNLNEVIPLLASNGQSISSF